MDDGKVVTITFVCKRLIDRTLTGKELADVKQHEQKHFDDFQALAKTLQQSIQHAIHLDKPIDMDNRMEWFNWDVNEASNVFHRRLGMMPNVMLQPNLPRTNP